MLDVILASSCTDVYGITSNMDASSGIGYFQGNDSDFPFEDGLILSTGNIATAAGPNEALNTASSINGLPGVLH